MNVPNQLYDLVLLNIGHIVHHADWNFEGIYSHFSRIYLVDTGEAWVIVEGVKHHLIPGFLYLIPAFTRHTDMSEGEFSHYYIHVLESTNQRISIFDQYRFPLGVPISLFDKELVKRLYDINPSYALQSSSPLAYDNQSTLLANLERYQKQSLALQFETKGILLQLLSRFWEQAIPMQVDKQNRILQALHYIMEHLNEPLTVSELANYSLLSKDHFIRLFRREVGVTPIDYIVQKRIESAQIALVMEERKSVNEIAYSLGFRNLSHFNRLFKRITGMTPTEYKRMRLVE